KPPLYGDNRSFERAGLAIAVIDAAVHTVITRQVTAPAPFDDTPIGLRRRRTMVEAMQRLEQAVQRDCAGRPASQPELDVIAAAVAVDYLQLRFADAAWRIATPALDAWLAEVKRRPAFADTGPR
ncbi:MAG: glutathione S-transferase family protein, partial [Betaproteobacteria bacterium]|nr:glutathione S-transferase family protein [Betaproteobacteria bacterium]